MYDIALRHVHDLIPTNVTGVFWFVFVIRQCLILNVVLGL